MNESNYASLSAGLLARKGQARPAMRPQLYKFTEDDDLGWNDMGSEMLTPEQKAALMPDPAAALAKPAFAAPAPIGDSARADSSLPRADSSLPRADSSLPRPGDSVLQVKADSQPPREPALRPVVTAHPAATQRPRGANTKSKAAFTLRLDPERHLKLRLACAHAGSSAQQLVTAALDEYLSANFSESAKAGPKVAAG